MLGLWTPVEDMHFNSLYFLFRTASSQVLTWMCTQNSARSTRLASNIQRMPTPCQHYRAGQNAYTILTSENGGVFYKGGEICSIQQTVGFIAQHNVGFCHSYPVSVHKEK